jgi:hypothetical protein
MSSACSSTAGTQPRAAPHRRRMWGRTARQDAVGGGLRHVQLWCARAGLALPGQARPGQHWVLQTATRGAGPRGAGAAPSPRLTSELHPAHHHLQGGRPLPGRVTPTSTCLHAGSARCRTPPAPTPQRCSSHAACSAAWAPQVARAARAAAWGRQVGRRRCSRREAAPGLQAMAAMAARLLAEDLPLHSTAQRSPPEPGQPSPSTPLQRSAAGEGGAWGRQRRHVSTACQAVWAAALPRVPPRCLPAWAGWLAGWLAGRGRCCPPV